MGIGWGTLSITNMNHRFQFCLKTAFWGQVTNRLTPIASENLGHGALWPLVMSSQVTWTCLPTLLVNGTGAGWNKDSGPQGFENKRTEGFEPLFLQIPFLKTPVCVSGIFFSLATKSLIVRGFISGIDLKNQIPAWNKAPLCSQRRTGPAE